MNVPKSDGISLAGRDHCMLGLDKPLGHVIQTQVPRRETEEMPNLQRAQLVRTVADLLVLGEQQPAARAPLGYPLLIGDVRGIISIEVRNEVDDPTTLTQPFG
ncbi:MAG TPA: hypothetical protein VFI00_00600 [Kribbella sp.]|nr:hypothetical protein [Kribbella sp.]